MSETNCIPTSIAPSTEALKMSTKLTPAKLRELDSRLREPFPPELIYWKPQLVSYKGEDSTAKGAAYADNLNTGVIAVYLANERLDVLGANIQCHHIVIRVACLGLFGSCGRLAGFLTRYSACLV